MFQNERPCHWRPWMNWVSFFSELTCGFYNHSMRWTVSPSRDSKSLQATDTGISSGLIWNWATWLGLNQLRQLPMWHTWKLYYPKACKNATSCRLTETKRLGSNSDSPRNRKSRNSIQPHNVKSCDIQGLTVCMIYIGMKLNLTGRYKLYITSISDLTEIRR